MANIGHIVRLVDGNPKLDFVSQPIEDDISILPEPLDNGDILPAPLILQGLGEVPVVQSDLRGTDRMQSEHHYCKV